MWAAAGEICVACLNPGAERPLRVFGAAKTRAAAEKKPLRVAVALLQAEIEKCDRCPRPSEGALHARVWSERSVPSFSLPQGPPPFP